jgi:hypothetical protein
MRRQINRRRWQRTSQMHTAWNISDLGGIAIRRQPPRSLAHLKRSVTEVKWQEARTWAESKVTGKKYRHSRLRELRQKPDSGPANANKWLASTSRRRVTVSPANASRGRRSCPPLSAGGALTGPRIGSTSSSVVRTGNASRNAYGQRCGGRHGEVRTGSGSGTSSPTNDAVRRSWTSSPPLMWGGWPRSWLNKTPRERHRSGSSGSGMKGKRSRMSPV